MKKVVLISILSYLVFFWQFLLSSYSFWKSDAQNFYIPARFYLYEKIVQERTFPFWTERIFSGFPIYADFENGYLNYINVISILIFGPINSYKILHFLSYLLGSISLYYWMRSKGLGIIGFTIANLIFFFNSFVINHQIHFNIIAGIYLFPVIIFLIDRLIKNVKTSYLIYLSVVISYIALWGHPQTTFLVCLGGVVYFLFFSYKNITLKKAVYIGLTSLLLIGTQILPQFISSYNLYQNSYREETINYKKGSLIPQASPLIFVPFLFGKEKDYIGVLQIQADYSYTETYIYIGITSFILGLLGFYFIEKKRMFFLLYTYILLFIFLGFIGLNTFINEQTPIIGIFRYWQRSMILFSFSIAIFAGYFIENITRKILTKKEVIISTFYFLIPIFYLILLSYSNSDFYKSFKKNGVAKIQNLLSIEALYLRNDFYLYLTLLFTLILFIIFLYLLFKKIERENIRNVLLYIPVLICLVDLFFFNKDILSFRLNDINEFSLPKVGEKYENLRVIPKNINLDGNEFLYLKSWSPFGYSQLADNDYVNKFYKSGLSELKKNNVTLRPENFSPLSRFGISYILQAEGDQKINEKKIDLILQDIKGEYLTKKEGEINLNVETENNDKIIILLRYNKNWDVKINNQEVNYTEEGLFIGLDLRKGTNNILIKYIPKDFYLGLYISLFLLIPTFLIIRNKNKFLHD